MTFTKVQITAACVLFAAVPLTWQHFVQTAVARQRTTIEAQIAESTRRANALEAEAAELERGAEQARTEAADAQLQLDRIRAQLTNPAARSRYHWDDSSPYARVPKEVLSRQYHYPGAIDTARGHLSDGIKKLLQMTEDEARQTQDAIDRLLSTYETLEADLMKRGQPTEQELKRYSAAEVRAFDVPYIGSNQMSQLRQDFFGRVTAILGSDRAEVFTNSLGVWMPLQDDSNASGSPEGIFWSNLRALLCQPKPGEKTMHFVFETSSGPQAFHHEYDIGPDEVPPLYAPYVQDWIAALRSSRP